jgi:hypothetical protein
MEDPDESSGLFYNNIIRGPEQSGPLSFQKPTAFVETNA